MKYFVLVFIFVIFPLKALGDTINLAAGLTVGPYIIESNDSGFEADIVREAFTLEGYTVKFIYQPLLRTKISFEDGTVDGVLTVQAHYPEIQGCFLSEEYITYHNFAVTLQSRNLKIMTIDNLTDKRIIGFQQAAFALGKEFESMTKKNFKYREMPNQSGQVSMLFLKRTDLIVLDQRIFKYHRNRLINISTEQPVTFHELFEPSFYRIAFRDGKIRDAFNLGLLKLQKSGRYKEIIDSYINNE